MVAAIQLSIMSGGLFGSTASCLCDRDPRLRPV